jgi:hypothetical protein
MSTRTYLPTVADIGVLFEEECTSVGAASIDSYRDEQRAFERAVWEATEVVRPGDGIRGGVALRAEGPWVLVHPYTVREVCTNGAISAHVAATFRVERVQAEAQTISAAFVGGFETELRSAIRACADPAHLAQAAEQMRGAAEMDAEMMIMILPHLLRSMGPVQQDVLSIIVDRFDDAGDRSGFGLVNAVTSVARDARDPEVKWKLEMAGGELLSRVAPEPVMGIRVVGANQAASVPV